MHAKLNRRVCVVGGVLPHTMVCSTHKMIKTKTKVAKQKHVVTAPQTSGDHFYIVGIGGSAGGLAAFSDLLSHIPTDTGMAFVIIQHLSPDAESSLSEILAGKTHLPVTEVKNNSTIEPDHVYVIPPNKSMTVENNVLKLSPRKKTGLSLPIDEFFSSLAKEKKNNAIGVLLSGTGSDGTQGMRAIREMGGTTFAQDDSAEFPEMPKSAMAAGVVDHVSSPTEISVQLTRITTEPEQESPLDREMAGEEHPLDEAKDKDLTKILQLVLNSSDVDFTYYKPGTIKRRIARRMLLGGIVDFPQYAAYLEQHPEEVELLYQDILIKVTNFFRDPHVFEFLNEKIFPELFKHDPHSVRIWIPGCSTGEEVYSFAISLAQFMKKRKSNIPVQIFGTDISSVALNKARSGKYPLSIEAFVPSELLDAYFDKHEDSYEVARGIRAMCIFAKHNMIKDIPFSKMDIVSCRNVLIYLDSVLQKKAFPIFHYALNPGGFLVLGTAESAEKFHDLFKTTDKEEKIYTKKDVSHSHYGPIFSSIRQANPALAHATRVLEKVAVPLAPVKINIEHEADKIVLSRHAPAGLIINDDLTIVQFRGDVSPYLTPAPGRATLDLIKMAHKGLLAKILGMLDRVRKSGSTVRGAHTSMNIDLEVIPLGGAEADEKHFLILFEDHTKATKQTKTTLKQENNDQTREFLGIEKGLNSTIDQLRTLIEAREATNEELRATHEEVMSANEELQSTNEELETTKEELQSTNQELMTLNYELQNRNSDLRSTEKAHNIMIPQMEEHVDELFRKDEFISILGHELRNPLTPILYALELVKLHGVTDPELVPLITTISRQAKIMNGLIKSLLDSARAAGGKIELSLVPADIGMVLHNAIETARPLIEDCGHTLEVTPLATPLRMLVDPMRLEQIIVNLLNNAAKYTRPGGHITIALRTQDDHVCFSVKDNGIGISEEMLPRVFDYFSQENQPLSNFKGGLGVGLMLAKVLSELHGGTLTAESDGLGRGSKFILDLPIRKPEANSNNESETLNLKKEALKKRSIVVVDDNVALADIFGKLLRVLNQDVTVVYSGKAAIATVRDTKPDMMFIDIAMPDMSGYELADILRKDPSLKNTKLIAVSGFGSEYSEASQKAGFETHLTKPIGVTELMEFLSRAQGGVTSRDLSGAIKELFP